MDGEKKMRRRKLQLLKFRVEACSPMLHKNSWTVLTASADYRVQRGHEYFFASGASKPRGIQLITNCAQLITNCANIIANFEL